MDIRLNGAMYINDKEIFFDSLNVSTENVEFELSDEYDDNIKLNKNLMRELDEMEGDFELNNDFINLDEAIDDYLDILLSCDMKPDYIRKALEMFAMELTDGDLEDLDDEFY